MITYRIALAGALLLVVFATIAILRPATGQSAEGPTMGEPRVFRNLTLIPVYDSQAKAGKGYITLDEGLAAKTVVISEGKGAGEQNTLRVTNNSDRPLFLMSAQVVQGGRQDRMLGSDYVVPSHTPEMRVAVYCVEHDRWTGSTEFGSTALAVASAEIRAAAQNGIFDEPDAPPAVLGNTATAGRAVGVSNLRQNAVDAAQRGVDAAQQQVWDRVAAKNALFGAKPATGTYREVLNASVAAAHNGVDPYVRALEDGFPNAEHCVGVVVAVNGKILAADVFGDPTLFRRLWPKLLNGYATDAAEQIRKAGSVIIAVTPDDAHAFLTGARGATKSTTRKAPASVSSRLESESALLYRVTPTEGGPALHENVLSK